MPKMIGLVWRQAYTHDQKKPEAQVSGARTRIDAPFAYLDGAPSGVGQLRDVDEVEEEGQPQRADEQG
jgi:hypothetical protein